MSETERIMRCRAHADQCRVWADLASQPARRDEFKKIAEQWAALAQDIEEIERIQIIGGKAEHARAI